MNELRQLRNDIAASLYLSPCGLETLANRDFLKGSSMRGIDGICDLLDKAHAMYFKGERMFIKKDWAKNNLHEYELDFRTKREKELDGMTSFAKAVFRHR